VGSRIKRPRTNSRRPPPSGCKPSSRLTPREVEDLADELHTFHRLYASCFQRREQRFWSFFYLCGQLSALERKTIEPMVLALQGPKPNAVRALDQFLGAGAWDMPTFLQRHQELVAESLGSPEGTVIVDGCGFPKQGNASAGVARQYCGAVGKVANCQEGVFVVYATPHGYTFLDCRLYVHESWFEAEFTERWQKCGIPEDLPFQTEPELALQMLQGLVQRQCVPFRWVTCDEHFGQNPAFLDGIADLGKWYLAEVPTDTRVWRRTPHVEPPGRSPRGPARRYPRVARNAPRAQEVRQLVPQLPSSMWHRYRIKEGSKGSLLADFAFLRVTTVRNGLPGPRVWLVIRRSVARVPEFKFHLSNAPREVSRIELVQQCGLRWPVETTLEEGKGELGMDHYETRSWRGWHHQMMQSFMAHLFLMRLRLAFQKNFGTHNGPGAHAKRWCTARRSSIFSQGIDMCRILSTSQLCSLLFASKAQTAILASVFTPSQTQSLQVI
jgi:SRSO17 transposase